MSTRGTIIRQRFETWAVANGWSIKRAEFGGPKYPDDTQCVWRGFQAAAEQGEIDRDELVAALQLALREIHNPGTARSVGKDADEIIRAAIAKASP